MSVTSPTSASPGLSILDWDEGAVHSWFSHIGLTQYEEVIYGQSNFISFTKLFFDSTDRYDADMMCYIDQGITGDVLAVVDHLALQDLGMTSVGHRLNVLRGVWELKKEQGLELGEDEWRPQGGS